MDDLRVCQSDDDSHAQDIAADVRASSQADADQCRADADVWRRVSELQDDVHALRLRLDRAVGGRCRIDEKSEPTSPQQVVDRANTHEQMRSLENQMGDIREDCGRNVNLIEAVQAKAGEALKQAEEAVHATQMSLELIREGDEASEKKLAALEADFKAKLNGCPQRSEIVLLESDLNNVLASLREDNKRDVDSAVESVENRFDQSCKTHVHNNFSDFESKVGKLCAEVKYLQTMHGQKLSEIEAGVAGLEDSVLGKFSRLDSVLGKLSETTVDKRTFEAHNQNIQQHMADLEETNKLLRKDLEGNVLATSALTNDIQAVFRLVEGCELDAKFAGIYNFVEEMRGNISGLEAVQKITTEIDDRSKVLEEDLQALSESVRAQALESTKVPKQPPEEWQDQCKQTAKKEAEAVVAEQCTKLCSIIERMRNAAVAESRKVLSEKWEIFRLENEKFGSEKCEEFRLENEQFRQLFLEDLKMSVEERSMEMRTFADKLRTSILQELQCALAGTQVIETPRASGNAAGAARKLRTAGSFSVPAA